MVEISHCYFEIQAALFNVLVLIGDIHNRSRHKNTAITRFSTDSGASGIGIN